MSVRIRGEAFQADFRHAGKRYRKDFGTKPEAELWEATTRARLLRGESVEEPGGFSKSDTCSTLEELLNSVHDTHWRGTKAESTALINANRVVNILGRLTHPAHITTTKVDFLVSELQKKGLTGATINRSLGALSKMLNHALARDWIIKKPTITRRKETEGRLRWLTEKEETGVLKWFEERGISEMFDLVGLLVDTGMRLAEGVGLEWSDISDGYIRVWGDRAKNGSFRSIPMTDRVVGILERRQAASKTPEIFPGTTKRRAQYWWQLMREDIGLDADEEFVLHALRHTFCSRLAQRGEDILVIKELAGHKCIQVTMRYTKLHKTNLQSAVKRLNGGYTGKSPAQPEGGHKVTGSDQVTKSEGSVTKEIYLSA